MPAISLIVPHNIRLQSFKQQLIALLQCLSCRINNLFQHLSWPYLMCEATTLNQQQHFSGLSLVKVVDASFTVTLTCTSTNTSDTPLWYTLGRVDRTGNMQVMHCTFANRFTWANEQLWAFFVETLYWPDEVFTFYTHYTEAETPPRGNSSGGTEHRRRDNLSGCDNGGERCISVH